MIRTRDLFRADFAHLPSYFSGFARGWGKCIFDWRIKRGIHAIDSMTLQLVAN